MTAIPPPPFDYPDLLSLARLVHDLDNAVTWPAALADQLHAWRDPEDPAPLQLCRHLISGHTVPLYGFAHAPRVVVCADCFTDWLEDVERALDGACQLCARPDAGALRIDAGFITVAAQLCPACTSKETPA